MTLLVHAHSLLGTHGTSMVKITLEAEQKVYLAEATEEDLELLMAWRSHPLVHQGFSIQQSPLSWAEHWAWWNGRSDRQDWLILFQEDGVVRRVGSASAFNLADKVPEVGLYVGEVTLWGKGVGRKAMTQVMEWLKEQGYQLCCAHIRDDNMSSQKMFASVGFRRTGHGGPGELRHEAALH